MALTQFVILHCEPYKELFSVLTVLEFQLKCLNDKHSGQFKIFRLKKKLWIGCFQVVPLVAFHGLKNLQYCVGYWGLFRMFRFQQISVCVLLGVLKTSIGKFVRLLWFSVVVKITA